MWKAFILLTALLWTDPGVEQALDFKGATLGMSLADFRKMFVGGSYPVPFAHVEKKKQTTRWVNVPAPYCTDSTPGKTALLYSQQLVDADIDWINGTVCSLPTERSVAAGEPLEILLFRFNEGNLSGVLFSFRSASYQNISQAFKDKYGPPSTVSSTEFQNVFGARWSGESLSWKRGSQRILLSEGGEKDVAWTKGNPGVAVIYDEARLPHKAIPKDF